MKGYFYLACRKLKDNMAHSVVLVLCVVLASLLILVLGNIGFYMGQNVEKIITSTEQTMDFLSMIFSMIASIINDFTTSPF